MKKIILFLVGAFIILLSGVLYLYNKPHRNIRKEKTYHLIEAAQLTSFYTSDEAKADSMYLGKILEIQGVAKLAQDFQETGIIILKGNGASDVRCKLKESEIQQAIKHAGTQLTLKGICIGMLVDVNMNDCIIINK